MQYTYEYKTVFVFWQDNDTPNRFYADGWEPLFQTPCNEGIALTLRRKVKDTL
jgi:hypothetical protein